MLGKLMTLKGSGVLFMLTWTLHSADHIRRGTDLTSDGVIWAGTVAAMLIAVAVTLVLTDHPVAPFAVVAVGGALAVGVSLTHLVPGWGYFSEPLVFGSEADRWAVWAVMPEIMAAAWWAWIGLGVLRDQEFQMPQSGSDGGKAFGQAAQ